jgi:hypothetical protein
MFIHDVLPQLAATPRCSMNWRSTSCVENATDRRRKGYSGYLAGEPRPNLRFMRMLWRSVRDKKLALCRNNGADRLYVSRRIRGAYTQLAVNRQRLDAHAPMGILLVPMPNRPLLSLRQPGEASVICFPEYPESASEWRGTPWPSVRFQGG